MSKATILLVDDEQNYLDLITDILTNKEFKVIYSLDGEMACRVAEKFLPDMILMDWEMPNMNGIEAIKVLKSQEKTADIPIIMASGAMTDVKNLETALEAGAVDFLKKPIESTELIARINVALKLSGSFKEIKRQKEILEDLHREKDGLMGIVAHDLRTPLSQIKGLSDIISFEENLNESQLSDLKLIAKICESGFSLIKDLLDINSIQYQNSSVRLKPLYISKFMQQLVKNYEGNALKKNIQYQYHPPAEDFQIFTDEDCVSRIMDNLISNAIKFTHPYKSVGIFLSMEEEFVKVIVKDEGQGLSDEEIPLMFKKFQRLSSKPTAGEHSTGLGLAIVKALVDKLEGQIQVKSKLGVGTEFTLFLPVNELNKPA